MQGETIRRCLLVATVAAMLPAGARAQTVDIPYQGWLTLDDQPCNGTRSMVFSLYDAPASAAAVWSDTYDVAVSDGAFSVVLPVPEGVVFGNPALYLGVTVAGEALSNRQRIYPSMYAARSGTDEFWVRGEDSPGLALTNGLRGHTDTLADVSEISNDTGGEMALVIAGNKSAGGSRRVKIYDELAVNGPVTVEGRTFRGMRLDQVVNGLTTSAVTGEADQDSTSLGVSVSDGICFATERFDRSGLSGSGLADVTTRCSVIPVGSPPTWHLITEVSCQGSGCVVGQVYCEARCVRWNW